MFLKLHTSIHVNKDKKGTKFPTGNSIARDLFRLQHDGDSVIQRFLLRLPARRPLGEGGELPGLKWNNEKAERRGEE